MKKITLLASAMAIFAVMALPSVASAGGWHIDPPGTSFSIAGGPQILTGSTTNVNCASLTGTGSYDSNNQTTGKISLKFNNCTEPIFGTSCTTSGEVTGTIKPTQNLVFHNIYTGDNKTTPGILITSNSGHFASFSCFFGGISVVVNGNGVMGTVTSPGCGKSSTTGKVKFNGTGTVQEHRQVTNTGTIFSLSSSVNGGAFNAAAQDGEATLTFPQSSTMTCI
jgi:hypothetical protein